MSLFESMLLCLGLLVTPGPTNTLLALAAATDGRRRALRLLPAEVAGYLVTVVPLMIFGQQVLAAVPSLQVLVQIIAGLWVGVLAIGLWRPVRAGARADRVTSLRVFLTTLMNPKALVFGLVLLPSVTDQPWPLVVACFVLCILTVATVWVCLAGFAQGTSEIRMRRLASVVLIALSGFLLQSGIAAALHA